MMQQRTGLIMGAAAAVSVVAAALLGGNGETVRTALPDGAPMFPGLASQIAQARRIEIVHQARALAITRTAAGPDAAWVLRDHAGFPVQPAAVHTLLVELAGLRRVEQRTNNPELFARLGLDDPARPDATATLVRVLDGDGAPIAAAVVGHAPDAGSSSETYVRSPDAGQSWLASGDLDAPTDWTDWIDSGLLDVLPEDIVAISSRRGDGPVLEVARQAGGLVLTAPAGHPPLDAYKIDDMASAFAGLDLLDVRPAAQMPGTPLGETVAVTREGLELDAQLSKAADQVWLTLSARGSGQSAGTAARLQARLSGWAFRIKASRTQALVPALADLVAYQPVVQPALVLTKSIAVPRSRRR